MGTRRRRRTESTGVVLLFVVLLVFAVLASVIGRMISAVVICVGLIVAGAVAWDVVSLVRQRSPGFAATRGLLRIAATPLRWFRPEPLRIEALEELLAMSPAEFEDAIARSLREHGYRDVRGCGGAGDLGVDIMCRDSNGLRVGLQCKRYTPSKSVGSRDVQLFIGMIATHHPVDRGVFVTTSNYTEPARRLAAQHNIRLLTGADLMRLFGVDGRPPAL